MKTSTLCLGCLSLTLLAAGLAGVMDASAGPRSTGDHALSPLATTSDAIAEWIAPAEVSKPASDRAREHGSRRPGTMRVLSDAALPDLPAPRCDGLPGIDKLIVVAPAWEDTDWHAIRADNLRSLRVQTRELKPVKKPASNDSSGSIDSRPTELRQRA